MSAPEKVHWTPAVLTQAWTRPATTWKAAQTLPVGTAVVVEWSTARAKAYVHLRQRWGYSSLFNMPLAVASEYVRHEG